MQWSKGVVSEQWIGNYVEGSGRGLIWDSVQTFPGKAEENSEELVRIAGLRAEIVLRDDPNNKQDR
jgi:hypothetical protein